MNKVEVLKIFGIDAKENILGWLDITNPLIGRGISLSQEGGEIKLSLSGWWANLEEATEHLQALTKGVAILEALTDVS